jgi:hypothetical protein
MMAKEETIKAIVREIFALDKPKIDDTRKEEIRDFITSTINGDIPSLHLVINATLKNGAEGCICYILTDKRFIKIDTDTTGKTTTSSSYPLDTLIGVHRALTEDGQEQFSIAFRIGSLGLTYSKEEKDIADFFQRVDENLREKS